MRKCGRQKGFDTLVVHTLNYECWLQYLNILVAQVYLSGGACGLIRITATNLTNSSY